ncbi:MAG: DNA/RNA nuclease SfsA [Myxococcales bacterium]|nr:DNA/RNA nuclease SfsA [Myxococcales bacterium]
MQFAEPLIEAVFVRRYKRFFTDVLLPDGTPLTVHCPNSGSMRNCQPEGGRCWISDSHNPARKLRYTLELVEVDGALALVNTAQPNGLVEEAIKDGTITELQGYDTLRREVRYADNSRIDLLLESGDRLCYVEVKNVSLGIGDGVLRFPDAVTTRGVKHLHALTEMVKAGHRAVQFYCAARTDARRVEPADDIDPAYGAALRAASAAGVELLAFRCEASPLGLRLAERVPVFL